MPTSTASSGNRKLYLFALGPLLAGVVLSLFGPSGEIAPVRFFEAMLRPDSGSPESLIFWSLRIPRTLAVLLCGAALSAAKRPAEKKGAVAKQPLFLFAGVPRRRRQKGIE